ncbi:hypothetical protein C8R47DRAFT_1313360 [Mycena vitilis]|nr:hypothetical protein C8R47DRAFT_1313360 [Mycena vitilis]
MQGLRLIPLSPACRVRCSQTANMPIREAPEPFSIVAPALARDIPVLPLAVITTMVAVPLGVRFASPARLTAILEDSISKAKAAHDEAVEAGQISRSQMRAFKNLKREVSAIRVETLRGSQSYWGLLSGFLKGRTFTVLRCIWKVKKFESELEVICFSFAVAVR